MQPVFCVFAGIVCQLLPSISNGETIYIFPSGASGSSPVFGTQARHSCSAGYYLVGSSQRNCVGDGSAPSGVWNGSAATCIGLNAYILLLAP